MNAKHLGILNSLVTFAAEHIPGGLSEDEIEVAQIVGGWALKGKLVDPRLSRIFDEASGALPQDAGELLNFIQELEKEMEEGKEPVSRIKYTPVFVGFTRDEEKIVIYKNVDNESELHIRRGKSPGGLEKLRALGPGSEIHTQFDTIHQQFRIMVHSTYFNGEAIGHRTDLINEDGIRLWEP